MSEAVERHASVVRWGVRALLGIVLAGCGFQGHHGVGVVDAAGDAPGDAAPDTAPDAPDAPEGQTCLGDGAFRICVPTPTRPFAVQGTANTGIDTDANPAACIYVTQDGRPTACVIAATTITIDDNILFVSGGHPAVLFATESIA